MQFPTTALIPDRDMLLLQDPAYGGIIPNRMSVLPTTREQAWTTFVFDANPGDTVAFVVKTIHGCMAENLVPRGQSRGDAQTADAR